MNIQLQQENNNLLKQLVNLLSIQLQPVVGKKEAKMLLGIDDDHQLYFLVRNNHLKKHHFGRDKYDQAELKRVHEMIKAGHIVLPKKSK